MPIRDFFCTKCGHSFERRFATQAEDAKAKNGAGDACPKCNYTAIRIPSRTAPPQFRGSGFYQTDYK